MSGSSAPTLRSASARAAAAASEPTWFKAASGEKKVAAQGWSFRRIINYAVACAAATFLSINTTLAVQWWWQAKRTHGHSPRSDSAWSENAFVDFDGIAEEVVESNDLRDALNPAVAQLVADEKTVTEDADAETAAAVDAILASRGQEPRIRRPLADVTEPSADHCSTLLPTSSITNEGAERLKSVRATLDKIFEAASGFWAGGSEEAAAVSKAAGDGPPGPCAEATYGEIEADGLDAVLAALTRGAPARLSGKGPFFDVVADLGAGVGRTAAAAVLLGHALQAFGVELGPQRFAMGCRAFARPKQEQAKQPADAKRQANLELLRGDARTWPELAASRGWPKCGPGWAFYLGAECFRDSLLGAIADAVTRGCEPGARLAVLGRRLPAGVVAATAPDGRSGASVFRELGEVSARTTWSSGTEVYLYELSA